MYLNCAGNLPARVIGGRLIPRCATADMLVGRSLQIRMMCSGLREQSVLLRVTDELDVVLDGKLLKHAAAKRADGLRAQ